MKTAIKQELKGAFKAIVAIAILGVMIGVGVATTLMSDDGFFVDGNKVLVEGDYTSWTKVWNNTLLDGVYTNDKLIFHIDEVNEVLYLSWGDDNSDARFGIFNLADYSVVFNSTPNVWYQRDYFDIYDMKNYCFGNVYLAYGGASRSLQTYVLLSRSDQKTIEVWRGDATPLWSRNIQLDTDSDTEGIYSGMISPTGKWILVYESWYEELILYEGS